MDMETNKPLTPDESKQQPDFPPVPFYEAPRPEPVKKPLFDLRTGDVAFGICAVIFSVFTAVSGIFGGYAFGYCLSCLLMMGLFGVYFAKRVAVRFLPVLCGIIAVANAAVFICTSNGSVRFFSAVTSFLLSLVCFGDLLNGASKGNRETLGIFYTAGATLGNIGVSLKSLFLIGNGKQKAIGKALVGVLCAVPLLLIIVPLLISSDDAFQGMMRKLFSNSFSNFWESIFGLILSVFVLSYGFSLKKARVKQASNGNPASIENVYIISFLSVISICYMLYLFSQLAYFFSAFRGFLPDKEITYAEYARKGFFEMCVIAVINLILVFVALLLAKKKEGKVCTAIKALATFVATFTLIIIATAISKMVLYIDTYGMTVLRLTTSAFMVFLAIVFLSVILRIYLRNINIIKTALVAAGCILLLLGTLNVNAVCARYNYESYISKRLDSVDVKAMYQLGDEGIPYLVKLYDDKDPAVSSKAKSYLVQVMYNHFDGLVSDSKITVSSLKALEKKNDFAHFSIPRTVAYDSLYTFIDEHPKFAKDFWK